MAGVVDHPALFNHCGAFPLGVFDGLNHTHQRDVSAGGRAACEQIKTHRNTNTDILENATTQTIRNIIFLT